MKKKILGVMMIATMAGGIFAGTNVTPVKAEEYPQMIVFEDVPYGFWAYDAIMDLAYHKIILGYGNGKYGVGDLITREQVAGTIYRTLEIKEEGPVANPYKDVSDSTTTFKKDGHKSLYYENSTGSFLIRLKKSFVQVLKSGYLPISSPCL